ncbi:malonate--CoA ligase ACSF3, mitochondrial [Ischnura elegans]|uniref:malonate--CoA ligase ACSF3, mitochondrial n=1 Tax=Ischnura elegans TaxID=197161 RepID=UPI001ED8AA8B|nr:malonate--CoA ligase ACSF3, mitochondrial [Ischnura elegans]XP_046386431.1 malonate--CoA ligase ACSF3, mitochondrial [Ischnura elegans]
MVFHWSSLICRSKCVFLKNSSVLKQLIRLHSRVSPSMLHVARPQKSVTPPSENKVLPVFRHAERFASRTAIRDRHGDYTYEGIFLSSNQLAVQITEILRGRQGERVALLCPNDASYVIAQWACWMSGQIVVPLCQDHPLPVMEHYVRDSDVALILAGQEYLELASQLMEKGRQMLVVEDALRVLARRHGPNRAVSSLAAADEEVDLQPNHILKGGLDDEFYADSDALIIYTSGTTGPPKGVVLTHSNIQHQAYSLIRSWAWNEKDIILHTLPLHHIHGIINVLLCPLFVGAKCLMLPKFETSQVWSQLLSINMPAQDRINVFMAVPTIYAKLIEEYDKIFSKNARMKEYIKTVCTQKIRLMVSGSAPLPLPIFDRWEEITGHRLLERYGMSEVGMALSNPLKGERKPGFVGTPLPQVQVKIVASTEEGEKVVAEGNEIETRIPPGAKEGDVGELCVRGPTVFRNYWRNREATNKCLGADGWFKTGDSALYSNGSYKIVGRSSVDIIKTGGYKVSALEIETYLLGHPDIQDCAVVALPDMTWGQKVAAIVVPRQGKEVILSKLREWSKSRMAHYAIPTVLKCVEHLPRNHMGKVNKKELVKHMFPEKAK